MADPPHQQEQDTVVDGRAPATLIADEPTTVDSAPGDEPIRWHETTDVVVVGFGAAGACAAMEAADHRVAVTVLERFAGGGTTKMSGGIIYLGGGTAYQVNAGFGDSPENMVRYLELETRGVVKQQTLRRFCQESAATLTWLERQGVPSGSLYCPFKTSYPVSKYTLLEHAARYWASQPRELHWQRRRHRGEGISQPAPRHARGRRGPYSAHFVAHRRPQYPDQHDR